MQALVETTGGLFPAHTYLVDGDNLVAYIRVGEVEPFYFKRPIKGFSKSGRKFTKADTGLFDAPVVDVIAESNVKLVVGSKGETYTVNLDEGTCTCAGYTYRGTCKHVKDVA